MIILGLFSKDISDNVFELAHDMSDRNEKLQEENIELRNKLNEIRNKQLNNIRNKDNKDIDLENLIDEHGHVDGNLIYEALKKHFKNYKKISIDEYIEKDTDINFKINITREVRGILLQPIFGAGGVQTKMGYKTKHYKNIEVILNFDGTLRFNETVFDSEDLPIVQYLFKVATIMKKVSHKKYMGK